MKHTLTLLLLGAFTLIGNGCTRNLQQISTAETNFSSGGLIQPAAVTEITPLDSVTDLSEELEQVPEAVGADEDAVDDNCPKSLPKDPDADPLQLAQNRLQTNLDDALEHCRKAHDFRQQSHLEEALKELDQAYLLIMQVDTDDFPALMQQKEDLRFLISKRILEIYASRRSALAGHYKAIPITLNRYVQREIDSFTKGREKRFFKESYQRSGRYRKQIEKQLAEAGLPLELAWLPLIESGFKTRALSKARALGLWQFIPSTGYKFGLKRDTYIDERLDPEKSTQAAVQYLKELHQLFGDWSTVLAAYNCGEGRVLRIIRNQKLDYLDHFWDLYERLPRETARYVPRFLACLHIVNHPEQYGLDAVRLDPLRKYDSVAIQKQIHLKDAASALAIPGRVLTDLNPELRYKITPEKAYQLRVPLGKAPLMAERLDTIPVSRVVRTNYVLHRVRSGETLSTIARRYRTSVRKIMKANRLRRSSFILAGKRLRIPQRGTLHVRNSASRLRSQAVSTQAGYAPYRVRSGDSLWLIARRHGTTVLKLRKINSLANNRLQVGQVLLVPKQGTKQLVRTVSSEEPVSAG